MLKAFAPSVEKLDVSELLAAVIAVIIRMSAKMPKAMMTTVMADRSLFDRILFHDKESVSLFSILFQAKVK